MKETTIKPKELESIDLKGKSYVTVNSRIKYLRENFEGYKLTSEIISYYPAEMIEVEGKMRKKSAEVWMKASLWDGDGNLVATGHAMEKEDSSFVNATSYVENCETSAWGRCLANFGIGVDDNVASADELANAIKNQR